MPSEIEIEQDPSTRAHPSTKAQDEAHGDGRPTTRDHPKGDVLGPIYTGVDMLLERLIEVHGEPRFDIAPELTRSRS